MLKLLRHATRMRPGPRHRGRARPSVRYIHPVDRSRSLLDPRNYLVGIILLGSVGLVALPLGADAVNAALGHRAADGCRVATVIDGDTVSLWCPGRGLNRARLSSIDAPELFSPRCVSEWIAAQRATWALRRLLWQDGALSVVHRGTDRYGRLLVDLTVGSTRIGPALVAAGHARPYDGGRRAGWCA